jgi:hypothetical protein
MGFVQQNPSFIQLIRAGSALPFIHTSKTIVYALKQLR